MVEIGSVIQACVTRVEPYGIFLTHGAESVFVHLPEVSWLPTKKLQERFHGGDVLDLYVLRYNYRDRIIVGSMRRLHPEENPYRQLSRLDPQTVLDAKVVQSIGNEVTVKLPNGAWGHIPKYRLAAELKAGDPIEVVIAGLEVEEGRLWLEPARHTAQLDGASKVPLAVGTPV